MTRSDAEPLALEGGYWERQGLVMVWVEAPPPIFEARTPDPQPPKGWEQITLELKARNSSDEALRKAHAAWNRGERHDPLTVARNREWERRYRKSRREQGLA